jgi:hypothetical protein
VRTLKIYGAGSATANGVATVIIPTKTILRGVQWAVQVDCITDSASVDLELSRASAREIAVNGAQQAISEIVAFSNFVTSGLSTGGLNAFFPVSIPLDQGQIVYLHVLIAGTMSYVTTAILHYE